MNEYFSQLFANRGLLRGLFACVNCDALFAAARDEHRRRGRGALVASESELPSFQDDNALVDVLYVTEDEVEAAEPMPGLGGLKAAVRRYDAESSFVLAFTTDVPQ